MTSTNAGTRVSGYQAIRYGPNESVSAMSRCTSQLSMSSCIFLRPRHPKTVSKQLNSLHSASMTDMVG